MTLYANVYLSFSIRFITAEIVCVASNIFIRRPSSVHRDIKPENILFVDAGHVKIGDFGLAVIGVTEDFRIGHNFCGTIFYPAPQILCGKPYYTSADYYSLGVTVYEMVLGEHPFNTDQDLEEFVVTVLTTTACYPEDMDSHLKDVIVKFLIKSQDTRWKLVQNIRNHLFFKDIDWEELEGRKSPSPLSLTTIQDEPSYTAMKVDDFMSCEELATELKPEEQQNFRGFSYQSDLRP